MRYLLLISILIAGAGAAVAQSSGPYSYFAVPPCRSVDTRYGAGPNAGPPLSAGVKRDFTLKGGCGVPTSAKAVSVNVTIANPETTSWLTIWPAGGPMPVVSTINFDERDWALANGAIITLGSTSPDVSVLNANGSVNVIIDVMGYFE